MTREKADSLRSRPTRLDEGPLDYEPENELGVVFLFSYLARRRWGLRVEIIRAGFPDCIAYRGRQQIRIEFEYRSSSFRVHKHRERECDWIVCWIHDWPAVPERLVVKELRKEFGLGFNVWLQPVRGQYADRIGQVSRETWSVPGQASKGDLVLFYKASPNRSIQDLFEITEPVRHVSAGWKPGRDYMARVRRVCALPTPLHLQEMQTHPILSTAGFIRGRMQGRRRISVHWPEILRAILDRNPSLRKTLQRFGPDRLD